MSAVPSTSHFPRPFPLQPCPPSAPCTFPALSTGLFILIVMALTPSPPLSAATGHNLGTDCREHGAFACHDTEPGSFTRCIDHQLFLFHCPIGLHFNTLSQTCDWPENADCGNRDGSSEEGGGGGSSSGGTSNEVHSGGSSEEDSDEEEVTHNEVQRGDVDHRQRKGQESWQRNHVKTKSWEQLASTASRGSKRLQDSSPIRLSNSEKPWWRPDNVDPRAWTDISNLVEVPFDGSLSAGASYDQNQKQEEEGQQGGKRNSGRVKIQPEAAEGGKQKSEGGGTRGHGHSHQPVVKLDERPRSENVQLPDGPCSEDSCQLPHCYCPGTAIPGGLSPSNTPQMVMITFDDEVSAAYYGYFQRLFRPGRYNPNGCPVRGCLFVSGSGTDYDLVYPLYAMGVEVASHTVSHKFPHTWWASASYRDYVDEVEGMKRALSSNAGVPYEAVRGFRVPFLQLGGDNMYKALYDNKFLYDTSMFTGSVWEGSDPVWPFTLDHPVPEQYCQHGPCPQSGYPGLWEIPVQRWYGVDGHSCAMPDGCTASADAEEDLEFFRSNFMRYYQSNRAPFGLFVHARWFHTEHHLDALDRFIDELMQLEDVYIVTPSQVIEWMRNPASLDRIKSFGPWGCEGSASTEEEWR